MKKYFKPGFAGTLSVMTALCVIANYADGINAMEGWEKAMVTIAIVTISFIIAMPIWLMAITMWHKAHKKSYLCFKNWCINLYHIIDAD